MARPRLALRGLVMAGAAVLAAGCGAEMETLAPFDVKVGALEQCSGGSPNAVQEIKRFQVTVADSDGVDTFSESIAFGNNSNFTVADVPEGTNQEVTLLGFTEANQLGWFAHKKGVTIEKGASVDVPMILSKFGGYSCPDTSEAAEYTNRIFPSVTQLSDKHFLIAGGLTNVDTSSGQTKFVSGDSGKKAFIYNSQTGALKRLSTLMNVGRGAHAAIVVKTQTKTQVVMFGGTTAMIHNPNSTKKFPWDFDTIEALSTVEVFEYDQDPFEGQFKAFAGGVAPQMFTKRVFPTANIISDDGLGLVCGGGPWGVADKPNAIVFRECDVWDPVASDFLRDETNTQISNNFMQQYRAGHSSVVFDRGNTVRILFYGGVTEGPQAEIYNSSSEQRKGVSGSFAHAPIDGVPHSFFQSLTPVGDNRIIMIGGVNWNPNEFLSPSTNNAFEIRLFDEGDTVRTEATAIPGLTVGRYFHTAASTGGGRLVVAGGFTSPTDLSVTDNVVFLQPIGLAQPELAEMQFQARGGMAALALPNNTILMAGGLATEADLGDSPGVLEIYTPSNLISPE